MDELISTLFSLGGGGGSVFGGMRDPPFFRGGIRINLKLMAGCGDTKNMAGTPIRCSFIGGIRDKPKTNGKMRDSKI